MFSQALKTQLVFALLVAMFVAWSGHAAAWLQNPAHPMLGSHASSHAHAHEHDEPLGATCALCQLQHDHSSLNADHLHETPYPTVSIKVHAPAERSLLLAAPRHRLPEDPIFLIERPPRSRFVL